MYPLLFGVFGLRALDCLGFQGLWFYGFNPKGRGSSPYTQCISIIRRTNCQMAKDPRHHGGGASVGGREMQGPLLQGAGWNKGSHERGPGSKREA